MALSLLPLYTKEIGFIHGTDLRLNVEGLDDAELNVSRIPHFSN